MDFLLWTSVLGTAAFAVSGAMLAVQKKMDLFGVNILALATAVGGGAIRDLLIGQTPPVMFLHPAYATIAILTANVVFAVSSLHRRLPPGRIAALYERTLALSDALGLAAFTVNGVSIGMESASPTFFLAVSLGVVTGVGGGVLRDMLAQEMPAVCVKDIYAVAALAGAVCTAFLWSRVPPEAAMSLGFCVVLVIRLLAIARHWNLPRIR